MTTPVNSVLITLRRAYPDLKNGIWETRLSISDLLEGRAA